MTIQSPKLRVVVAIFSLLLPWTLRRIFLQLILGYQLHPSSKIGLSLVMPGMLVMKANSKIGDFNICKSLDTLMLEKSASIGRFNLITGYSTSTVSSRSFIHEPDRESVLLVKRHAAISNRHLIDCTNKITLGQYSILAGYSSQLFTHSVNLKESVQASHSIEIGDYCFVGSCSVILPGSKLPDYSVLGAKGLLSKKYLQTYYLYAGVPARPIKPLPEDLGYFNRRSGYIY